MQTTSSKIHFSPQGCFNLERASTCTQTRTHTHTHQSTRYWRHYFFTFALRSTPNCANKVHQPRNNCGRVPRLLLLMSTTTFSTGNSFSSTTSNSHIIIININIRSCTHLHKALMGEGGRTSSPANTESGAHSCEWLLQSFDSIPHYMHFSHFILFRHGMAALLQESGG